MVYTMQLTAHPIAVMVVLVHGLFSLAGGTIGYLKARSAASLVAGAGSGALLLGCAYGMAQGHRMAMAGSLIIALALGGRFLGTWRKNRRVMPDLLMVLCSFATIVAVGLVLLTS